MSEQPSRYPCIYWLDGGLCGKFTDDAVRSYCLNGLCQYERRSNAYRIRSMSDEELANTLSWISNLKTADEWLDWLRREATHEQVD